MSGVVRRAWVDWHIGWHDGAATRAEERAEASRCRERKWRAEYERRWPSAFAPVDRLEVPQWVRDAFSLDGLETRATTPESDAHHGSAPGAGAVRGDESASVARDGDGDE